MQGSADDATSTTQLKENGRGGRDTPFRDILQPAGGRQRELPQGTASRAFHPACLPLGSACHLTLRAMPYNKGAALPVCGVDSSGRAAARAQLAAIT